MNKQIAHLCLPVPDLCSEPSKPRHSQQNKNWTFPNAKASTGADTFLYSPHRLEGLHGSAMVEWGDWELGWVEGDVSGRRALTTLLLKANEFLLGFN